jgi:hypothetical protein
MLMSCPFCGTGADLPHETQEACIAALHSEISRVRLLMERLRPAIAEAPAPDDISGDSPNSQDPRGDRG